MPSLLKLLVLAAMLGQLPSCGGGNRTRDLVPDPRFSLNLIEVPADWPDEERDWPEEPDLALRQQQVFERYGAPDYFQVMWDRSGRLLTGQEFSQKFFGQNRGSSERSIRELEKAWVYLDEDKRITFPRRGIEEMPLDDAVEVVAEYGDPQDVKMTKDATGLDVTVFTYYDRGRVFYFREGEKIDEETIQANPGFRLRR